jgi:hypothetical protein
MSLFTPKELVKFSVSKALNQLAKCPQPGIPGETTGLEREVSDTLADRLKSLTGNSTRGFLLPISCLKALNVTTATAGGFMVGTELEAVIPALRSKSVVIDLGATILKILSAIVEYLSRIRLRLLNGWQRVKSFKNRIRITSKRCYLQSAARLWPRSLNSSFRRIALGSKILREVRFSAQSEPL